MHVHADTRTETAGHAAPHGSAPWLRAMAAPRGCAPWQRPMAAPHGSAPWLRPMAAPHGSAPWQRPMAAPHGCPTHLDAVPGCIQSGTAGRVRSTGTHRRAPAAAASKRSRTRGWQPRHPAVAAARTSRRWHAQVDGSGTDAVGGCTSIGARSIRASIVGTLS
eukprot:364195-Chlamydomonas_euryale.AAC.16